MPGTGSQKINTLQCLRAVAVLLVVYAHVIDLQSAKGGLSRQAGFYYLQNFGAAGVDIFFVISGFIITIISQQYRSAVGLFILKRLVRIVPLYWLVSGCLMIYACFTREGFYDTYTILKTFVFLPLFDKDRFAPPVLFVGWTLSFEIFFYLVVALWMKINPKKYLVLTTLFFLCCMLFNTVVPSANVLLTFAGNPILLEFLLGMLAGVIYMKAKTIRPVYLWALMIAGIAWLLTTIFTGYQNISEMPFIINSKLSLLRVVLWGIPAALLVTAVVLLEKNRKLTAGKPWVAVGDASYSIYLVHAPFLLFTYMGWERSGIISTVPPDLLIIITLVLCILAGYTFYRLVERPLLGWLQRSIGK